jgi:uncharacterized protein YeaO (DUF488 family)
MKTVCTNWDEFQKHYMDAMFHMKGWCRVDDVEELKEIISNLQNLINDMYGNAHDMHRGAEVMEDRLRLYRSSIESLGFKRDLTAPKV